MEQEDGEAIIHEYYDVAPTIVKHINHSDRKEEVYRHIWETYLNPCIHMIESERMQECRDLYIQMVHDTWKKSISILIHYHNRQHEILCQQES